MALRRAARRALNAINTTSDHGKSNNTAIRSPYIFPFRCAPRDSLPILPRCGSTSIPSGQFQEDFEIAVQRRGLAVEVDVLDRKPAHVSRNAWIDRFGDNAVHTGKRADVDDTVRSARPEVDGLADGDDHLPRGALGREVRAGVFQHLSHRIQILAILQEATERTPESMLVSALDPFPELRPEHGEGKPMASHGELAFLRLIRVPDPLADIGEPGFPAAPFQPPDEVLIAEGVEAGEDLPHNADGRPRLLPHRDLREAVGRLRDALDQRPQVRSG